MSKSPASSAICSLNFKAGQDIIKAAKEDLWEDIDLKEDLLIGKGVLWVLLWLGFMLLYTVLDVAVWRKIAPHYAKYLNLFSISLCILVFLVLLTRKNHFTIDLSKNISPQAILLSIGCAILFYLVLDKGIDPIFEQIFPASEENYQQALKSLSSAPVISLIRVCVLAPFIEEILMRGFLLDGLSRNYGNATALLVSAFLFALLHFNMVQTLSAFICGVVLGLLYLHTGSIFCGMTAHIGYNLISYTAMILPMYK